MDKRKELEYRIEVMESILVYSYSLLKDSDRLLTTPIKGEYRVVKTSRFLKKTRLAFYKLGIIELCKLFGQATYSNQFSFYLLKKDYDLEFKCIVSSLSILDEDNFKNKIKLLKELRNQHFAHTDTDIISVFNPDRKKRNKIHEIRFYINDAFYLIGIAEKIIIEINEKILGITKNYILEEEKDAELFLSNQMDLLNNYVNNSNHLH